MQPIAVMMRGRMVHHRMAIPNCCATAATIPKSSGRSIRGTLNMTLLDAAEAAGARVHFDQRLVAVDWDKSTLQLCDEAGATREHAASLLIGADGAGSALRAAIAQRARSRRALRTARSWLQGAGDSRFHG
jgi:kynurenine 3-monooxygenase